MVRSDRPQPDLELSLAEILEEIERLIRQGEQVDLETYRTRCPDRYEDLTQMLPTLKRLVEFGGPLP